MNKSRLEAFSDGVLAIIITIMALEIKTPYNASWQIFSGLLFVLVAVFWIVPDKNIERALGKNNDHV
ncbi:MAG: TMEM175 family protein [Puia sp.]